MFISFFHRFTGRQILVNLESVDKVEVRRVPDSMDDVWEVVVFYRDERRFNPVDGENTWVGTYEVIAEGSKQDCRNVFQKIVANIENKNRLLVISEPE